LFLTDLLTDKLALPIRFYPVLPTSIDHG